MKKILLLAVSSALLSSLSACSAGSSNTMQTVLAQSAYSNASLGGTYSVSFLNVYDKTNEIIPGNNPFFEGTGTLQMNGAGVISGGTLYIYPSNAMTPCVFATSGSYSLQNTALGTATVILSGSTAGCTSGTTWQLALAAANGGSAIQFARSDGNMASGSGVKQ